MPSPSPSPKPADDSYVGTKFVPRTNTLPTPAYKSGFNENKLVRTLTEGWKKQVENEDSVVYKVLANVQKHKAKTIEGDIPAPDGFARKPVFWQILLISSIFGVILGFVSIVFLFFAERFPKYWVHNADFEDWDDVRWYAGKKYYILITGGTGLLVGSLRYFLKYPETIDGLFKEIAHFHVEPSTAPATIFLSAISLGGGCSLGPEQALGTIGGGFATWLVEHYLVFPDKTDGQLVVLCGMCAAFGALFPTPILAVLIIYELGQPPKDFMESIVSLSAGACVSFAIYYQYCQYFSLDHLTSNGVILSLQWKFHNHQCVLAMVIGIISAAICLLVVLTMGIMRQVFNRIRDRINMNTRLNGTIVCCMIGGLIVGTVSWVLPLTIGDGNLGTSAAIRLTFQQLQNEDGHKMQANLLINSAFAKMFTLGVSLNCGFAGGFVMPMITIGTFSGCVMSLYYTTQPMGFCVSCFMAAVPAGICPMPFTLLGIAVYCFYFGIYQTVPIYIAIITSYTVVCGSGIFRKLADQGNAVAEARKAQLKEQEMRQSEIYRGSDSSAMNGSASPKPYVPPSPTDGTLRTSLLPK